MWYAYLLPIVKPFLISPDASGANTLDIAASTRVDAATLMVELLNFGVTFLRIRYICEVGPSCWSALQALGKQDLLLPSPEAQRISMLRLETDDETTALTITCGECRHVWQLPRLVATMQERIVLQSWLNVIVCERKKQLQNVIAKKPVKALMPIFSPRNLTGCLMLRARQS